MDGTRRCQAQSYPSKNLNIVVSIGAGTGMDVLARLYAEKLSAALGKPVIVENKPGAATMLAATQVAQSPPDGHTLVVLTSGALAINQSLYKQINYNPENDFTPISLYVKSPLILVVNPNLPPKTVPEFIALRQAGESAAQLRVASAPARSSTSRWSSPSSASILRPLTCRIATPGSRSPISSPAMCRVGFVEAGASIPADQGGQAARARGVVVEPAAAAA